MAKRKKSLNDLIYNPDNVLVEKLKTIEHYNIVDELDTRSEEDFVYNVGKVVGTGTNMVDLMGKTIYFVRNVSFIITVQGTMDDLHMINADPSARVILSVID